MLKLIFTLLLAGSATAFAPTSVQKISSALEAKTAVTPERKQELQQWDYGGLFQATVRIENEPNASFALSLFFVSMWLLRFVQSPWWPSSDTHDFGCFFTLIHRLGLALVR